MCSPAVVTRLVSPGATKVEQILYFFNGIIDIFSSLVDL